MKLWLDKIWFYLLQLLIYIKRILVWILKYIWQVIIWLVNFLRKTIGFQIYKIGFKIQKYTSKLRIPWDIRLVELFGRRSILQVILFVVALIIIFPQSKLYTVKSMEIPGRQSLLYKLVGPGEQDFNLNLEEVNADFTAITPPKTQSWKEGTVIAQPQTNNKQVVLGPQEISNITSGGEAVAKPMIMTGANLSTGTTEDTKRTEIVYHIVQPGDTIGALAEQYHISVATILWANGLSSRSLIRPNNKLKILPVSGVLHKVIKNDTISKIAKKYQAEANDIIKFNNLQENGSDIRVGEELVVPGGKMPAIKKIYTHYYQNLPIPSGAFSSIPNSSITDSKAGKGHKFPWGQCTWYVAQKRYVPWRGNAKDWLRNARRMGYKIGTKPVVGAIVALRENSYYGHVAYVEAVSKNTITFSEMNYRGLGIYSRRTLKRNSFRIIGYIY